MGKFSMVLFLFPYFGAWGKPMLVVCRNGGLLRMMNRFSHGGEIWVEESKIAKPVLNTT